MSPTNRTKGACLPTEENRFLKLIIDAMPGMIAYWDSQLCCRFASKAYLEWFGKAPEDIVGMSMKSLLGERLFAMNEGYISGALAGQAQHFERTLTKADGSVGYTFARYIPDIEDGAVAGFFVLVSDITPLKQAELKVKEAEARTQAILNNVTDGIITINEKGAITSINPAAQNLFGYDATALIGKNINLLMPEPHRSSHDSYLARHQLKGTKVISKGHELEGLTQDARRFPIELSVTEVMSLNQKEFVGVIRDITEQKMAQDQLVRLAQLDGLTGLANRRRFDEVLASEYAGHCRSGEELSLILIDIDHFKLFNDTYGHVTGDDCLRRVSQAIGTVIVRATDLAARYGGEEFACILPGTNQDGAVLIAEKIRQEVNRLSIPHSHSSTARHVTISLGVATVRCLAERSALSIVTHADEQLYAAKSGGRNRCVSACFK